MKDVVEEPQGGGGGEPEITLVAVANETFYVVEGEEHLDQMLQADGTFPTPILVLHFKAAADIQVAMGARIDMTQYWQVHPAIVDRLRDSNLLIEKVA